MPTLNDSRYKTGTVKEYIHALRSFERFGPQVVFQKEIPARPQEYAQLDKEWPYILSTAIQTTGIHSYYTHQAEAINLIRKNKNVIVSTPTASGKSLIYNLPVIEKIIPDPGTIMTTWQRSGRVGRQQRDSLVILTAQEDALESLLQQAGRPAQNSASTTARPTDIKKETHNKNIIKVKRFGVFDLETKRSAAEVGGWHNAARMGISVAVLYDSRSGSFHTYWEKDIPRMVDHLKELDLVVGFNNKRFDNKVLSAYTMFNLHSLPTLDILDVIHQRLGYRLSLDRLAEHTLGVKKSADGLLALQWFKEGRLEEIRQYCRDDVRITRDLFLFGLQNHHLLFQNKTGNVVRLPIDFSIELI